MRLLFVNDVHPATPHISAVRLWAFARELARLGHQVVFITLCVQDQSPAWTDVRLKDTLQGHDWRQPLLLELQAPVTARVRPLAALIRRMRTASDLVVRGGPKWHWSHTVAAHAEK